MTVNIHKHPDRTRETFSVEFDPVLKTASSEILCRIVAAIAERYVAEHYQEIVALIDQQAIATLAVAEAGAKIRETLERKIPDKVLEVERTVLARRGLFGGIRRI